ncbi:hypothetical protein QJS10_CPB18g00449 [Acorus calamus]|uniref:Uncharacterized protein n=1 Tax=Acorus calamus TaxID=4465 RepID=A0AAV9CSE0_ACOCL|nr:hypothetical protein QJS10_CPB18g00449 [Acorus calamus]
MRPLGVSDSDAWWDLVHLSSWFHDYRLSDCFHNPIVGSDDDNGRGSFLPDDPFDKDLDRPQKPKKNTNVKKIIHTRHYIAKSHNRT